MWFTRAIYDSQNCTETVNPFLKCFQVPSDKVYDIIASKSIIDNENVNHHMTMYGCDGDIPADKVGMKLSSSSLAKDHQN